MRRAVLAGAVVGALALATVHWVGLLFGGVAVGLYARSWPRALAGGALFGAFAWLVFVAILADAGRLAAYLGSGQLLYVSVAIPLALGVLGALAYGLSPRASTA